jgi:selenocysteine-specific elongation factor
LLEIIARLSPGSGEALHVRPEAVRAGTPNRQLPAADQAALDSLEKLLLEAGATPPLPAELQTQLGVGARFPAFVSLLEEKGTVVRVAEGLLYHRTALDAIEQKLRAHLASQPQMSMADFKDLTGLSRKFAVPLLEYFDRRGVTTRQGDARLPGPLLRVR